MRAVGRSNRPDEPDESGYIADFLNAKYGPHRLITYRSVPSLVEAGISELDGDILRSPPA